MMTTRVISKTISKTARRVLNGPAWAATLSSWIPALKAKEKHLQSLKRRKTTLKLHLRRATSLRVRRAFEIVWRLLRVMAAFMTLKSSLSTLRSNLRVSLQRRLKVWIENLQRSLKARRESQPEKSLRHSVFSKKWFREVLLDLLINFQKLRPPFRAAEPPNKWVKLKNRLKRLRSKA
jgi:hypothetical protein